MFGVNPSKVYISNTGRGGTAYHTTTECPNFPPATKTLTPENPEFDHVVEARDECQWCRYDTLDVLDIPDEDDEPG